MYLICTRRCVTAPAPLHCCGLSALLLRWEKLLLLWLVDTREVQQLSLAAEAKESHDCALDALLTSSVMSWILSKRSSTPPPPPLLCC